MIEVTSGKSTGTQDLSVLTAPQASFERMWLVKSLGDTTSGNLTDRLEELTGFTITPTEIRVGFLVAEKAAAKITIVERQGKFYQDVEIDGQKSSCEIAEPQFNKLAGAFNGGAPDEMNSLLIASSDRGDDVTLVKNGARAWQKFSVNCVPFELELTNDQFEALMKMTQYKLIKDLYHVPVTPLGRGGVYGALSVYHCNDNFRQGAALIQVSGDNSFVPPAWFDAEISHQSIRNIERYISGEQELGESLLS
jgi:hypothetical protein